MGIPLWQLLLLFFLSFSFSLSLSFLPFLTSLALAGWQRRTSGPGLHTPPIAFLLQSVVIFSCIQKCITNSAGQTLHSYFQYSDRRRRGRRGEWGGKGGTLTDINKSFHCVGAEAWQDRKISGGHVCLHRRQSSVNRRGTAVLELLSSIACPALSPHSTTLPTPQQHFQLPIAQLGGLELALMFNYYTLMFTSTRTAVV